MDTSFSALFCDDIRQEGNGKLLLIGVYQENLSCPEPIVVQLTGLVRFKGVPKGQIPIRLRVEYDSERVLEGDAKLNVINETGTGAFPLPYFEVKVEGPGKIDLWISCADGEERLVESLPVALNGK